MDLPAIQSAICARRHDFKTTWRTAEHVTRAKSGAKATAVQTLSDCHVSLDRATRLECGAFYRRFWMGNEFVGALSVNVIHFRISSRATLFHSSFSNSYG